MAPITHIVLFHFKPEATAAERKKACDDMLGLKDKCMHPTSKKPYIKSSIGGVDNSIEGMQEGITHAFVVEFESEEDRDGYVGDPTHVAFVQSILPYLIKGQVTDITPGVF